MLGLLLVNIVEPLGLDGAVDECTDESGSAGVEVSQVGVQSNEIWDKVRTGVPWPQRGLRACRSRRSVSRMPWRPVGWSVNDR